MMSCDHDQIRATRSGPWRGFQDDGDGGCLELRQCQICHTTIAIPISAAAATAWYLAGLVGDETIAEYEAKMLGPIYPAVVRFLRERAEKLWCLGCHGSGHDCADCEFSGNARCSNNRAHGLAVAVVDTWQLCAVCAREQEGGT